MSFLFLQLGLLTIFFHCLVLVHLLQVDGKLLSAHFKFHFQLHDQFVLLNDLLLRLLQLLVSVAYLQLNVGVSQFKLVVDGLHFVNLNGVLGIELIHVLLELIDQLLLVVQLLLEHLQIFFALHHAPIVLRRHFELQVSFLQFFDLIVQVVEFGLVLLNFFLVL